MESINCTVPTESVYQTYYIFRLYRDNNENQGQETITDHESYSGKDDDDDENSQGYVTIK